MFPLNTILAWSINIIMNKKYDNNNIIIASRAYFLHLFLSRQFRLKPRNPSSEFCHLQATLTDFVTAGELQPLSLPLTPFPLSGAPPHVLGSLKPVGKQSAKARPKVTAALSISGRASFSLLDAIKLLDHAPVSASPSHAPFTPL
jgi:hypothetical protein